MPDLKTIKIPARPIDMVGLQLLDFQSIAEVAMALGESERATRHPDGVKQETVSTHSFMLALACLHYALKCHPQEAQPLDVGRLLTYALVHDLPEAKEGDVNTFLATPEVLAMKVTQDEEGLALIRQSLPELAAAVDDYHRSFQSGNMEARIVNYFDKMLPKITGILNYGAYFVDNNVTQDQVKRHNDRTLAREHLSGIPGEEALESFMTLVGGVLLGVFQGQQTVPGPDPGSDPRDVPTRTPKELVELRANSLKFYLQAIHGESGVQAPHGESGALEEGTEAQKSRVEDVEFTCDTCTRATVCCWSFDAYNTHGDCLWMK